MKLPKFVNKKMIIFVVLFVAFIYFSGIFHYMREGLEPYKPSSNALKVKDMNCCDCLNPGYICPRNPKQIYCKTFLGRNKINKDKYKCVYDNTTKTSYFEPK